MKDIMKTDRYLVNYYIFKRLYIFSENLFNSCQQGKRQSINIIPIFIEVTYSSIFQPLNGRLKYIQNGKHLKNLMSYAVSANTFIYYKV